jgi:hypothetical protein
MLGCGHHFQEMLANSEESVMKRCWMIKKTASFRIVFRIQAYYNLPSSMQKQTEIFNRLYTLATVSL